MGFVWSKNQNRLGTSKAKMLATVYQALRPDDPEHGKPCQKGDREAADAEDPDSGSEAMSLTDADTILLSSISSSDED